MACAAKLISKPCFIGGQAFVINSKIPWFLLCRYKYLKKRHTSFLSGSSISDFACDQQIYSQGCQISIEPSVDEKWRIHWSRLDQETIPRNFCLFGNKFASFRILSLLSCGSVSEFQNKWCRTGDTLRDYHCRALCGCELGAELSACEIAFM